MSEVPAEPESEEEYIAGEKPDAVDEVLRLVETRLGELELLGTPVELDRDEEVGVEEELDREDKVVIDEELGRFRLLELPIELKVEEEVDNRAEEDDKAEEELNCEVPVEVK